MKQTSLFAYSRGDIFVSNANVISVSPCQRERRRSRRRAERAAEGYRAEKLVAGELARARSRQGGQGGEAEHQRERSGAHRRREGPLVVKLSRVQHSPLLSSEQKVRVLAGDYGRREFYRYVV